MLSIKSRSRKIVVHWVHFKPRISSYGSLGPLPHVTNNIIERALLKHINRTRRSKMLEINIAWSFFPVGYLHQPRSIMQCIPFRLSGKPIILSTLYAFPIAKCFRFKIINFNRPIPWHIYLFCN